MYFKMYRMICIIFSLFITSYSSLLGQRLIGKIYETQTGKPIQGAQVTIEGLDGSTITNKEGKFNLKITSGEYFVKIFKPGYVTYNSLIRFGVVDYQLNVAMRASSDLTQEETEVGTRDINTRTYTDTPVAIDNIKVEKFADAFGQLDLSQLLHFVLPSFNSNRQSGSDGADHVDPSVLRGLGQDQVLVLVNGKRKHQASLVYLFGTTGRGNTPTDLNTIPVAAIERVEVLRDGASAQYGSDAIAGVINIVLKSDTNGLKFNTNHSITNDGDGFVQNYSLHYGKSLKNEGFFDVTADFLGRGRLYRPCSSSYSDLPRVKFGDAKMNNYSLYFNSESPLNRKQKVFFYSFGGVQFRDTDANSWTYEADNERNNKTIYPNGFEPRILSKIWDGTFSVGLKSKTNKAWNFDLNNTFGQNQMHYSVANTLNSSLGASSPLSFDAGGFGLMQNVTGINLARKFRNGLKNTNVALGSELRVENYYIFAGEEGSWKKYANPDDLPGGSQTFPGYRPENEVNKIRTNFGAYADVETDITRSFLLIFATRFERYSDFGNALNAKLSLRIKTNEVFAIRGSASTGFRAPSLAQSHFSAIYNDVVDGVSFEKVLTANNSSITKALGVQSLKQETATTISVGTIYKPNTVFSLTVDGYYVAVKNRILLTGDFTEDDPQVGQYLKPLEVKSALFFTNALNTKNYGVDVVGSVFSEVGEKGKLETMFSFNYTKITLGEVNTTQSLAGKEENYFSGRDKSFVLSAAPTYKYNLTFAYEEPRFNLNLRFVGFSKVDIKSHEQDAIGNYISNIYAARIISDASVRILLKKGTRLVLGCSNLLNSYPTRQNPAQSETGGMYEGVQMGYGGRFFFAKLRISL